MIDLLISSIRWAIVGLLAVSIVGMVLAPFFSDKRHDTEEYHD